MWPTWGNGVGLRCSVTTATRLHQSCYLDKARWRTNCCLPPSSVDRYVSVCRSSMTTFRPERFLMKKVGLSFILLALAIFGSSGIASAQMSVVNGASFDPAQPIAPGSFASIFGQSLCPQTMAGDWVAPGQLPSTLGGCSVAVNGAPAMMQYVSPGQFNFIMPAGAGSGQATVMVNNGSQMMTGNVAAGVAGPGMFAANGMGMGEGAMLNAAMWQMGPFSTTTN